jgi:hypothetical protein
MEGLDYVAIAADIAARIAGDGDRPAPAQKPQPKATAPQPKPLAKAQPKGDKITADQRRELITHSRSKGLSDEGLKYGLRCNGFSSTADLDELKFAELMVAIVDGAIVAHWNKEATAETDRVGVW